MNAWTKLNVTYKTLYERLIYINSLGCVQNKHKKGVYLNSGFEHIQITMFPQLKYGTSEKPNEPMKKI